MSCSQIQKKHLSKLLINIGNCKKS